MLKSSSISALFAEIVAGNARQQRGNTALVRRAKQRVHGPSSYVSLRSALLVRPPSLYVLLFIQLVMCIMFKGVR